MVRLWELCPESLATKSACHDGAFNEPAELAAEFSPRDLPPAKAGSGNQMALGSTGSASLHPWLHSAAGFAGSLRGKRLVKLV